ADGEVPGLPVRRPARQAPARVLVGLALSARLGTLGVQLLGGAVAAVGGALRDQLGRRLAVAVEPFGLSIGTEWAALGRSPVPFQPEPPEAVVDCLLVLGLAPPQVGV